MNETEMRNTDVPTPQTPEELKLYIETLLGLNHDYGTCVYAMSMAATATFNYMAHKLGVTGFQASCADLDIVRRTRRLKGPFMIVDGAQAVYPQYDIVESVTKFREDIRGWLADEAEKNLAKWAADNADEKLPGELRGAHPNVVAHWRMLVDTRPAKEPT